MKSENTEKQFLENGFSYCVYCLPNTSLFFQKQNPSSFTHYLVQKKLSRNTGHLLSARVCSKMQQPRENAQVLMSPPAWT